MMVPASTSRSTPVLRYAEEPDRRRPESGSSAYLRTDVDALRLVPQTSPPESHRHRGYVLLIVLLLLTLAAVSLAGVCRLTLRRSAAATAALADLQHRWGSVSAQYTLLSDAENVLERAEVAEGPGGPPVATLHGSFDLGRVRFDVDLCDDQARANVNGLLAWRGRAAAEALIRDLARAGGGHLVPHLPASATAAARGPLHSISTTPDADAPLDEPATDRVPPVFGSLTEVFPGAGWDDLQPSALGAALTCYGDGKVNLRRATVPVLSAACAPLLSAAQIGALSRAGRFAGNTLDVGNALSAVGADAATVLTLQGRLSDGSYTQSVWITAHDGGRTWRTWAVRDGGDPDHPRTFTGAW
jgi:hypothetical protein